MEGVWQKREKEVDLRRKEAYLRILQLYSEKQGNDY